MIPLVMANEVGKAQTFNQNLVLNCSFMDLKIIEIEVVNFIGK